MALKAYLRANLKNKAPHILFVQKEESMASPVNVHMAHFLLNHLVQAP